MNRCPNYKMKIILLWPIVVIKTILYFMNIRIYQNWSSSVHSMIIVLLLLLLLLLLIFFLLLIQILLTRKFSPPTEGLFLDTDKGWRALRAQRWFWWTVEQTTGLRELDSTFFSHLIPIFPTTTRKTTHPTNAPPTTNPFTVTPTNTTSPTNTAPTIT